MTHPVNAMVIDLSHWDPAHDYNAVRADGISGVVYKATEGGSYTDGTYPQQQQAAKAAGLLWGAYHFATADNVTSQIDNFMRYACPDPDELFCLDWEDYGDNTMSLRNVKEWISEVESQLGRQGQCVLYSGNTAKEALGDTVDEFLGARRLWLCQYGTSPTWQQSWHEFWLWQYTDGVIGPTPHSIDGVGACDINSYDGTLQGLTSEWATGYVSSPIVPGTEQVSILVAAPPGVIVKVRQVQTSARMSKLVRRGEAR